MKGKKQLSCPVTAFDGDRDVNHHLYGQYLEPTSSEWACLQTIIFFF